MSIRKRAAPKRKYNSSQRQSQARQTRLRIAQAARGLFLKHGYAGTRIDAIAAQAGISKEAIYSIFRNKQGVLAFLLDISLGGDELPLPVIERPGPQEVLKEKDQKRQIRKFAQQAGEILSHAAAVFSVMRAAAETEPEIWRRVRELHRLRLDNMTAVIRHIAANGPLQAGLDEKRAGEIAWALTSPELYELFASQLGWSSRKYCEWLADMFARVLLPCE